MQLLIMKSDKPPHYKGDVVETRATGMPFGGKEPEAFILIEVPGLPMKEYRDKPLPFERLIDFDVVSWNRASDRFRLRLFSTNANSTAGAITKEEIETFINSWGGTVSSFGPKEVVFDIKIYDALTSEAFFEIDLSATVFEEVSYNSVTGIHRISADYSAVGTSPTYVETWVERLGMEIVSHTSRVLVYDADRSIVRSVFESDLQQKAKKRLARRRWHIAEAVVDAIVAQGGMVTVGKSTLDMYLKDKATNG